MLEWLPFGRDQLIRVALVLALLGSVTAAAFGIGYRASDAVLGDGSAYVQKGHTVVHVNAESGQADAEAARDLATGKQRLEVVQVRPGDVYVVNNATGEVWQLPTDTLQAGRVDTGAPTQPPAPGTGQTPNPGQQQGQPGQPGQEGQPGQQQGQQPRTQLVAGGGAAYLHDAVRGTLSRLEGQRAEPVQLPGRADAVVVDNSGTAWILSKADGAVFEVSGTTVRGTQTVAQPGEAARLTLAGNRPVVFLPERGKDGIIRVLGEGPELPELTVGAQPDGALQVARPSAGPSVLVTLSQRDDTLTTVDLSTGVETHLQLEGRGGTRSYGNPVITSSHVYVPDFNRRQIIVVQLKPLRQLRSVAVPGREPFFDVFERDGRVWVNDPYSRTLLSFNGEKWSEPDKGEGRGVSDGNDDNPPPSPTKAAQPPPGNKPSNRPSPRTSSNRPVAPPAPKMVNVPQVAGLSGAEACNRINTAELTCAPPVTREQPGCRTGQAIGTTPPAGQSVQVRTQVVVLVCGPVEVPGPLRGMVSDAACQTVEQAELVCARRDAGCTADATQVNRVAAQNPQPTTPVNKGTNVEVAYYTTICVASVVGMGPTQACATLAAQGLGCAQNPKEVTWQANVVHAQSVPPGTPVPLGTPVGIQYQDIPPHTLHRFKLDSREVRILNTSGHAPGPGWTLQSSAGGVYTTPDSAPGLVAVWQHRCVTQCGS
ncbi:MAG TPA: PASTA domain-containing protein, partial [Candidatus Limnocylindrales bacterium]